MVIGHELSHGFDASGRKFDSQGRLDDWWTNTSSHEFDRRKQCFVDQFSDYTISIAGSKYNVNGKLTVNENIADSGGVSRAWYAWSSLKKERNMRLKGLETYSSSQLFFINMATCWCSSVREETLKMELETGVHSPAKFRVLGSLSNSKEFSEAFQCSESDSMNPKNRCRVW